MQKAINKLAILLCILVNVFPFYNLPFNFARASSQVTFTSQADFQQGTVGETLDSDSSPSAFAQPPNSKEREEIAISEPRAKVFMGL